MNLAKQIVNAGVQPSNPEYLNNKIVENNVAVILNLTLVYLPFILVVQQHARELLYIPISGSALLTFSILLNRFRIYTLARLITALGPVLLVAVFAAYITAPGDRVVGSLLVLILSYTLLTFLLFDVREKVLLIVCLIFNILIFVFLTRLTDIFVSDINDSFIRDTNLYSYIVALGILLSNSILYFLSKTNYAAEITTQNLIADNEKQTEEIRKSEELLKRNLDEVKKAQEEEKNRAWVTEGLGLVNNIIRQNDNHEKLAEEVVGEVVKYLGANQGAIYLVEEDSNTKEEYLEIKGAYAFGKKKAMKDKVKPGEGLIGQCYLEKDVIFLTDVPQDFVRIKSGLGDAPPRNIVILPLIANDKMEGALEIASFEVLPEYKIDYLKKLGESLASSFNLNKINYQTKELLELSQQQQEEMRSQAEELQQNMEELQATQEEMERKARETQEQNQQLLQQEEELRQNMEEIAAQAEEMEKTMKQLEEMQQEMKAREDVLNNSTIMSEADLNGTIIFANDKLCKVAKYSREEMIGKGHNLFRHPDMPAALFKLLWNTIQAGKVFRGIVKNKAKDGSVYWVDATIAPVLDDNGKPKKYIGVRYVIEKEEVAKKLFDEQLERLGLEK